MLAFEQNRAFDEMIQAAFKGRVLDERTAVIAGLACAMAVRCEICIEHFLDQGREAGLSREEIGAVAAIAMCVRAGSAKNTALTAYEAWSGRGEEDDS